jgi:hypothetical protein
MVLEVGNVVRVENPSPEQVRQQLRTLPLEAPLLTLAEDDKAKRFIQTRPYSGGYRVEWRDGSSRRHALVTFDRVEDLLCAYLRRDESAVRKGANWRGVHWFNDPFPWLILAAVVSAAILVIVFTGEFFSIMRWR